MRYLKTNPGCWIQGVSGLPGGLLSKCLLFVIMALQAVICYGQEKPEEGDHAADGPKNILSVDLGVHYNYNFGTNYTPPHDVIGHPSYSSGPSGGLSTHFCWSKQLGLVYEYKFSRHFRIKGGAYYFRRKFLTTSDPDSVIKYVQSSGYENPPVRSNYSANNIEISLLAGYCYKRFSVFLGTKVTVYSTIHIRQRLLNGDDLERFSKYADGDIDHILYPTIKIEYQILKLSKKVPLALYLAADMRSWSHYDFQLGAELAFLKK